MATLRLFNLGDGYVQWTISGLSNNFTTANGYISAGITEYQFTQSNPSIYGVVSEVWAGTSGGKSVTGTEYVGAGYHKYWGFTQGDSMYYPAGSASVTITEGPDRPANWEWWSTVAPDYPIAFTVAEWNALYAKINEFLAYKGQGPWPNFVPVSKGTEISAKIVQEVTAAIQGMTSASMPPLPVAGRTVITASYFNALKEYLNSVT